jgi:hypothetical protein
MNTEGIKFFHTNADTSKGDLVQPMTQVRVV